MDADSNSNETDPQSQCFRCNPLAIIFGGDFNCSSTISQSTCSCTTRQETVTCYTEGCTLADRTEASSFANRTEVSSFSAISAASSFSAGTAGSGSLDSCSVDSIGRLLIRLEDNDKSLRGLVVDCKALDREAAAEISLYLPNNKYLKKICLRCVKKSIHREILCKVLSGLKGNSSVESIVIEDTNINPEVASWLVPLLAHRRGLKSIGMTSCKGSGLENLFVAMQQNQDIRHLRFQSCYWEEHHADIVASSLTIMELHSLSLVDINIAPDGWPYLFRNIGQCRELVALDLSRNELDANIVYLLTKSMVIQKHISKLSLSLCDLDDQCMVELAKGLRYHPSLTSLDISQNIYITDKGVIFLLDLLRFNTNISDLNVYDCCFTRQSRRAIQSGLRYNNSFLRNVLSRGVYDAIASVVDFPEEEKKKNFGDPTPTYNPAALGNDGAISEERDADEETIATSVGGDVRQLNEERSPPDDGASVLKDDSSIRTEVNAA